MKDPKDWQWRVGTTTDKRVYLESDGFDDYDIRLYINGNIGSVWETVEVAERFAKTLNDHNIKISYLE